MLKEPWRFILIQSSHPNRLREVQLNQQRCWLIHFLSQSVRSIIILSSMFLQLGWGSDYVCWKQDIKDWQSDFLVSVWDLDLETANKPNPYNESGLQSSSHLTNGLWNDPIQHRQKFDNLSSGWWRVLDSFYGAHTNVLGDHCWPQNVQISLPQFGAARESKG